MITKIQIRKRNEQRIEATVICDNESVIKSILKFNRNQAELKGYYRPDFDVLQVIDKLWKKLKKYDTTIFFEHIKGHSILDYQAPLDNRADVCATIAFKYKQKNRNNIQ